MGFYIGSVYIPNRVVLGPMAGNTNYAYRKLAKFFGCGLVYTEMISDKGLSFNNKKTLDMIRVFPDEHPVAMQIFGSDVSSLVKSAQFLDQHSLCDIIDINMGCPVPKVVKSGAGSALLKDIPKIYEIVSAVVKSVSKPVTVKIRSGWDFNSINAVEVAKTIERAGAKAIAVHARTKTQLYSGVADWNIIKQVKQAVGIPVIGNGDIKNIYDAKKMIEETNCDAVMVARGSLGNPWIFRDIINYLDNNIILPKPIPTQIHEIIIKHCQYLEELKDEHLAMLEMRGQIAFYLKGLPNTATLKVQIFRASSLDEIIELVNSYFKM